MPNLPARRCLSHRRRLPYHCRCALGAGRFPTLNVSANDRPCHDDECSCCPQCSGLLATASASKVHLVIHEVTLPRITSCRGRGQHSLSVFTPGGRDALAPLSSLSMPSTTEFQLYVCATSFIRSSWHECTVFGCVKSLPNLRVKPEHPALLQCAWLNRSSLNEPAMWVPRGFHFGWWEDCVSALGKVICSDSRMTFGFNGHSRVELSPC